MGHLAIRELLENAVSKQIGSGMAASFGNLHSKNPLDESRDIYVGRSSHRSPSSAISEQTYFDLASLTKILATTTFVMKRYDQGALSLEASLLDSVSHSVKLHPSLHPVQIKELLSHSSGLPAWKPFYEEMRNRFGANLPWINLQTRKDAFDELVHAVPLENERGKKIVYSDLGFLYLENILSSHFQKDIESIWRAMGIAGLHFRPVLTNALTAKYFSDLAGEKIAATEICPWRGMLVGQVHDDNAWSRGGVAGHSGAFGRLRDVKTWLKQIFSGDFIGRNTLEKFTQEAVSIDGTRRTLGFDMPSMDGSGSTGFSFSRNTVGHLGFTGTSLWVDLETADYAILLTNRVHPSRDDLRIRWVRREFHKLVRALSK